MGSVLPVAGGGSPVALNISCNFRASVRPPSIFRNLTTMPTENDDLDDHRAAELSSLFADVGEQAPSDVAWQSDPSAVVNSFCHPDRKDALNSQEGRVLWHALRTNGYHPCSVYSASKRPAGDGWQTRAFDESTMWTAKAPGIGLVCGGLNGSGKPAALPKTTIVLDFDFRLVKAIKDWDERATKAAAKNDERAARFRIIADYLRAREPELARIEQVFATALQTIPALAKMRASTLERNRADSPNFALLFRNKDALNNQAPTLTYAIEIDGAIEHIEAFGIDVLASGKQLVAFHVHPETGAPWLWRDGVSPACTPVSELHLLSADTWATAWREIAAAGRTVGLGDAGGPTEEVRSGLRLFQGLVDQSSRPFPTEIPSNLTEQFDTPSPDRMRAMLEHLVSKGCFERREGVVKDAANRIVKVGWRECGMALKAAYGDEGFALWKATHEDELAHEAAPAQWASFATQARPGDVTLRTIMKAAADAGFLPTTSVPSHVLIDTVQFTGRGGDVKNGQLFADAYHNKMIHIYETGEWLIFDAQQGWISAPPGEAERAAKAVLKQMREHAAEQWKFASDHPGTKALMSHVERTSDARHLRAMIDMAKSEPGMTVRLNEFDNDPMLLGIANGVLDLNSHALLPVSPSVLVSKRCNVPFDANAACPRFQKFMEEVQPDHEMREFLQCWLGYCLTGMVDAQAFVFLHGLGANGKSVLVELSAWLLGDYAGKIQTEMLMHHQRNPQGPSPDIVALKGVRFAYANETEEGRRMDDARVKDLTGSDTQIGRVPYGKAAISFTPSHKLNIVGNHRPDVMDTSEGMWRRIKLVPFNQTIPEALRDPALLDALKAEGSGIFNWMLAGLRRYLQVGLRIPSIVTSATAQYREESDIIGEWIRDQCNTGVAFSDAKHGLYLDYKYWTEQNGHRPISQNKLTRRLNDRGYRLGSDKRTVQGLSLTPLARGSLGSNLL